MALGVPRNFPIIPLPDSCWNVPGVLGVGGHKTQLAWMSTGPSFQQALNSEHKLIALTDEYRERRFLLPVSRQFSASFALKSHRTKDRKWACVLPGHQQTPHPPCDSLFPMKIGTKFHSRRFLSRGVVTLGGREGRLGRMPKLTVGKLLYF